MDNQKYFDAFKRLGPALTGTNVSLPQKLRKIVGEFKEITQADGASIWLKEEDKLWCKAGVGHYENMEKGAYNQASYTLDPNGTNGLTAWIAVSGETVNIRSFEELISHPHWQGKFDSANYPDQDKGGHRCNSFLGAPLKINEEIIGVIKADNRKAEGDNPGYFTEADEQIFMLMASVTAIVIKNDQEYLKLQALERKANGLFNIVTRCIDLNQVEQILWSLIVGLTHEDGIGFNRAILFDISEEDENIFLKGIMANGPLDRDEANKIFHNIEQISAVKIDELINLYHEGSPRIPLQQRIQGKIYNISECKALCNILSVVNPNQPKLHITQENGFGELEKIFPALDIKTKLIIAFHLSGRGKMLCLCDNIYSILPFQITDVQGLVSAFVRHIQMAAARVESILLRESMAFMTIHSLKNHIVALKASLENIHMAQKQNLESPPKVSNEKMREIISQSVMGGFRKIARVRTLKDNYFAFIRANQKEDPVLIKLEDFLKEAVEYVSYPGLRTKFKMSLPSDKVELAVAKNALFIGLTTLLHNAIEALESDKNLQDPQILICYSEKGQQITDDTKLELAEIAVIDNGPGIKDSIKPNLFMPHKTTKATGTGMGLYTSLKFMQGQKGNIIYDENYKKGTKFIIQFPFEKKD